MKKKKIITIVLLVFILLSMFILNVYTPLIVDDYSYSFGLNGRLNSIKDILLYQKWHYLNWSGRSVAHFIAQFFLMNHKMLFNVFNTIAFLVIVYLISSLSDTKSKFSIQYYCLVYLGLWFLTPAYGQSFLWLTGSSNYLWTSMLVLLYLNVFMSISNNKNNNTNIFKMVGIALLGLIAGWTNENTGAGFIAMIIVFLFLQYKEKKKINRLQIAGLISNIVGFSIMILSPGNSIRSGGLFHSNIIIEWIKRFVNISVGLVNYFIIPIAIIVVLVSIYIYNKQKLDKTVYIFSIGIIISTYSMVISPQFPTRSWTIVAIYFVLVISALLKNLKIKTNIKKIVLIDTLILLGIIYTREWYLVYQESKRYYNTWESRRVEMEEGKKQGIYDFEFEGYSVPYKQCASYGMDDIFITKEDINNKKYARYFEVNSICLKKEDTNK